MSFEMKKPILIILAVIIFILGFGFSYLVFKNENACDKTLQFINPGPGCNTNYKIGKQDYTPLKDKLESYIAAKINGVKVGQVSVYFRDLHDGPIMGINENAYFVPASLLKVPLVITYYYLAEFNEKILDKMLVYKGDINNAGQQLEPDETIKENIPYKIRDLIYKTLVYSDNRSYTVLLNYLNNTLSLQKGTDLLLETYNNLGIVNPENTSQSTLTVKEYASIFRILYNATYLSRSDSNEILETLSKSNFNYGIKGGLPDKIIVSHKYGERYGLSDEKKQLHDCGIIYFPGNPYLLCVMTVGDNFNDLSSIIEDISKMIYEEFNSRQL
jgi:beta-lactamase class A